METIPVIKKSGSEYVYNPTGEMTFFSAQSKAGRDCIKQGDAENPAGEWKKLDLYCHGDTSVQMINGKVMIVLYHFSQNENGKVLPLTRGKIQLQAEGAKIFNKNITMEHLKTILAEYLVAK